MSTGVGLNLGTAYASIRLDGSQLQNDIRNARSNLQGFFGSVRNMGAQATQAGLALTGLTAPFTLFAKQGVGVAAQFEDALKEIEVRAGLTGEQLDVVKEKALAIGRDTVFSARQGADAFLQLLTSGQTLEEAFGTIDAVLAGAAANGQELGFVSDSITDIMAAMGLEVNGVTDGMSNAMYVIQALTDASGASSATFENLVYGFQNSAGQARLAGLSVEELAAALAVLDESGIKGAESGTALRSVLRSLQSENATDAMAAYGISLFDAEGNTRRLSDVMADLRGVMSGMTDQQQIGFMNELGDTYAQAGLSALIFGGDIDAMIGLMDEQASVTDLAAARMDTFSGAVKYVKGSLETFQIKVFTPFMDKRLRPFVVQVGQLINKLTEWADQYPAIAQMILLVMSALALLGGVLTAIGGAILAFGTLFSAAFAGIGAVIGVISLPFLAFIGLIAGLIALGVWAYQSNIGGFGDALRQLAATAKQVIAQDILPLLAELVVWLREQLPIAIATAREFWDTVLYPALERFFFLLSTVVIPAIGALIEWLGAHLPAALSTAAAFWNTVLKPALETVWAFIQNTLIPVFQRVVDWLITNIPIAISTAATFWNTVLKPALYEVWEFIQGSVIPIFQKVAGWLAVNIPIAISAAAKFWRETLKPALDEVWGFIQGSVIPIFQKVVGWLAVNIPIAISAAAKFWRETLKPALEEVWKFIQEHLIPLFGSLVHVYMALVGLAARALAGLWENVLKPALEKVWEFIVSKVMPILMVLAGYIKGILSDALNILSTLLSGVSTIISGTLNIALEALNGLIDDLAPAFDTLGKAIDKVKGFLDDLATEIDDLKLPDWLTPGSPTPFETGLRGIASALLIISGGSLLNFVSQFMINGQLLIFILMTMRTGLISLGGAVQIMGMTWGVVANFMLSGVLPALMILSAWLVNGVVGAVSAATGWLYYLISILYATAGSLYMLVGAVGYLAGALGGWLPGAVSAAVGWLYALINVMYAVSSVMGYLAAMSSYGANAVLYLAYGANVAAGAFWGLNYAVSVMAGSLGHLANMASWAINQLWALISVPKINLPFFAEGGRVTRGNPIVVGEEGTEVFVPDSNGTIIPHDQLQNAGSGRGAATGSSEYKIEFSGDIILPGITNESDGRRFGRDFARGIQEELGRRGLGIVNNEF